MSHTMDTNNALPFIKHHHLEKEFIIGYICPERPIAIHPTLFYKPCPHVSSIQSITIIKLSDFLYICTNSDIGGNN